MNPPITVLSPGAVKERSPVVVIVLMIVTCGVYSIYWLYKTSEELKNATGDDTINPGLDLLLALLTWGLWGVYLEYRNAQKVHHALVGRDPNRKDQTQTVLILNVAMFFVGITGFIATYLVQEELNQLARASQAG
jgi:preprotein translocase subunit Sss1